MQKLWAFWLLRWFLGEIELNLLSLSATISQLGSAVEDKAHFIAGLNIATTEC